MQSLLISLMSSEISLTFSHLILQPSFQVVSSQSMEFLYHNRVDSPAEAFIFLLARLLNSFGYRVCLTPPNLPTATTGARQQSLDQLGWARVSRSGLTSNVSSTIHAGNEQKVCISDPTLVKSLMFLHHLPGRYPQSTTTVSTYFLVNGSPYYSFALARTSSWSAYQSRPTFS